MPATKRGVFHNLSESKYAVSNGEIAFFFSSRYYRNKFLEGYQNFREKFIKRLTTVGGHKPPVNFETYADVCFYKEVEKRGFYSKVRGVEVSCQDVFQFALRRMTKPNTLDWLKIHERKLIGHKRNME